MHITLCKGMFMVSKRILCYLEYIKQQNMYDSWQIISSLYLIKLLLRSRNEFL